MAEEKAPEISDEVLLDIYVSGFASGAATAIEAMMPGSTIESLELGKRMAARLTYDPIGRETILKVLRNHLSGAEPQYVELEFRHGKGCQHG